MYQDGMPVAVVKPALIKGRGVAEFKIECGEPGKLIFELQTMSLHNPKKLIIDNQNLDEFSLAPSMWSAIVGKDAEQLLTLLLKEDQAARAAGAKSWTLTFFIDDPKSLGYSVNVGGVKEVRDHMLKWCAAPAGALLQAVREKAPKPQNDSYLVSQVFLAPNRTHILQFYESGIYQIKNIRAARGKSLEWEGSYTISSNTLVLDPNTPKQMNCGFRYTPQKDFVLSNCAYSGMFVAQQNVR